MVESVKAVSDLFAPVSGEVVATNDELGGKPGAGQQRPVRRRLDGPASGVADAGQLDDLLDADAYDALIAAG